MDQLNYYFADINYVAPGVLENKVLKRVVVERMHKWYNPINIYHEHFFEGIHRASGFMYKLSEKNAIVLTLTGYTLLLIDKKFVHDKIKKELA